MRLRASCWHMASPAPSHLALPPLPHAPAHTLLHGLVRALSLRRPAPGPLPLPQKDLPELCAHRYGHRIVLQLLAPYCPRYLPPQLLAIVRPPQKVYEAAAAGAGGEEAEEEAGQEGRGEAQSDEEEEEVRRGRGRSWLLVTQPIGCCAGS